MAGRIPEFDAGNLSLRPSETGVEAEAGAARRVGTFYNQQAGAQEMLARETDRLAGITEQVGRETEQLGSEKGAAMSAAGRAIGGGISDAGDAAVKYLDHQQISQGAASWSKLLQDTTTDWNNTVKNADPNNPHVAQDFMDSLEDRLSKFQENGFYTEGGQKWAEAHVDALRQHMAEKTMADMSTAAGDAVVANHRQTVNSLAETSYKDPSSVDFALAGLKSSAEGTISSSPNLSGTEAVRVRTELQQSGGEAIVKAGAIGAIQKSADPEKTADEWVKKYPQYITPAEGQMLGSNARQQIRARNYDFESSRRREKEVAQDRSAGLTSQYLIDVRSKDPRLQNDPTAVKILNDPGLTKADKSNLLNYLDRQNKPETDARTSQQTFIGLLRDLRAPNSNPDDVMQRAWDARLMDAGKPGSISEQDFSQFRNEVVARKTPEGAALEHDRSTFFHNYGTAIAGSTYTPAVGDPKMYNAEMDARRVEADLRSKNLDPHLAYDPSSQYFLGKPERIAKWQQSLQQDLQTRAQSPSGLPPAKDVTGVQVVPAPVATSVPRPPAPPPPAKGTIKDGYEFLGGSPGSAASWRKVEEKT